MMVKVKKPVMGYYLKNRCKTEFKQQRVNNLQQLTDYSKDFSQDCFAFSNNFNSGENGKLLLKCTVVKKRELGTVVKMYAFIYIKIF